MATLAEFLQDLTADGELYEPIDKGRIRCFACGHCCPIPEGAAGVCKVRFNHRGVLRVPYGYAAGMQCDPVEKKPFFHVLPGALAFSFGMLGCDLHCAYCQNWVSSQALRDPVAGAVPQTVDPVRIIRSAVAQDAEIVVSTYNEPLITAEWSAAIFKEARKAGLKTGFVSNGNGTPQAIEYLAPWIDFFKIDLKSFEDRSYRRLGGRLQPVLDTILELHRRGIWVEIVTLIVPGFNDGRDELERLTKFLVSVSPDIPWHVTAFHRDYRMTEPDDTSPEDLLRAARIGNEAGLRFVYAGNLPGWVGSLENTHCPGCSELLIERRGYRIRNYRIDEEGNCPKCRRPVPGRWARRFRPQIADRPFRPA